MAKTICVFGSSIAHGKRDREMGGWVNRLQVDLESKKNVKYTVYNLGISGDHSDDLLARYENEIIAREPNIIMVGIGMNDSSFRKQLNGPQVKPEKFSDNLENLLRISKKYNNHIVFIGLTKVDEAKTNPIPWNLDANYKNKDVIKYNSIIEKFCTSNSLPFIFMYDLLTDADLDDGLHPNAIGHEKMYQRVKEFLVKNDLIGG